MKHKIRAISLILTFFLISSSVPAFAYTGNSPFVSGKYIHSMRFSDKIVKNGIDVSEWQGKNINWKKVKSSGVQFVFIRIGYRKVRTGQLRDDKYWKRNLEGALKAGLDVGVYFFSQAISEAEASAEAKYILKRIEGYNIDLPVAIDFEFGKHYRLNRLMHKNAVQKEKNTKIISAFCNKVASKGYTPMVYANLTTLNKYMYPSKFEDNNYKIWCAQYNNMCRFYRNYSCWQYTSKGRVKGINGRVDCNFMYTDVCNTSSQKE